MPISVTSPSAILPEANMSRIALTLVVLSLSP
jgi:hypothetical protein